MVAQHIARSNAHARFVGLKIVFVQKLGGMGGHDGQIQLLRQIQAAHHRIFPLRSFGQALQFQIKPIGKHLRQIQRGLFGLFRPA